MRFFGWRRKRSPPLGRSPSASHSFSRLCGDWWRTRRRYEAGTLSSGRKRKFDFATCAVGQESKVDRAAELMRDEIPDEAGAEPGSNGSRYRRTGDLSPYDRQLRRGALVEQAVPVHRYA